MCKIIEAIEAVAPPQLAEAWDNIGLLVGYKDVEISTALIALDITDAVIDEALAIDANAVITHHPVIFKPINRINDGTAAGRRLLRLIENRICVFSAHTNLDVVEGGINDILFDALGLTEKESICETMPGVFAGRAGILAESLKLSEFAKHVQRCLGLDAARFCGDLDAPVGKVGLVAGSAANESFFAGAISAGCTTFVTSDIKFSAAQAALDMGLNLVDATHFGSENIFAENLKGRLSAVLPQCNFVVSNINGQVFNTTGVIMEG